VHSGPTIHRNEEKERLRRRQIDMLYDVACNPSSSDEARLFAVSLLAIEDEMKWTRLTPVARTFLARAGLGGPDYF
jgi:hypothetical protein